MRLREYFGSFFTAAYWEALGDLFMGVATARHRLRSRMWEQAEAEEENPTHPE